MVKPFTLFAAVLCLGLLGCGSSAAKKEPAKKAVAKTPNGRAPGPASKERQAFNAQGGKSLAKASGVDWTPDLKSSDLDTVKTAISELKNTGMKSAIPELEKVAKSHSNADIRRRAQEAVDSLKNRK